MKGFLRRQWFLLVLLAVVALGYVLPAPGLLVKKFGMAYFIFVMLFLMSYTLETSQIVRAITNFKGLAVCVGVGYVVIGGLNWLVAMKVFGGTPDIAVGLVIVGVVPCTLVSAAVWTRLAGGNDALALSATVTSNVVNFLVAPVMLSMMLSGYVEGTVRLPLGYMVWKLFMYVLVPVTLGQLARIPAGLRAFADRNKKAVSLVGRVIVLTVVLTAGSALGDRVLRVGWGDIDLGTLGLTGLAIAVIHVAAMLAAWALMRLLGAPREDRLAAVFSGGQKTLPLSLLIAETFFAPYTFAVLPPLMFHAIQLVIDSGYLGIAVPAEPDRAEEPAGLEAAE